MRELCLKTYVPSQVKPRGRAWSAPDYLTLLDIARDGFGWAELPQELVKRFGAGQLVELKVQGWPRRVSIDVVWSKLKPPGPAGLWLIDELRSSG